MACYAAATITPGWLSSLLMSYVIWAVLGVVRSPMGSVYCTESLLGKVLMTMSHLDGWLLV